MTHISTIGDYLKRGKKGKEETGRYFAESVKLSLQRMLKPFGKNVNVFLHLGVECTDDCDSISCDFLYF